jgi:hypothetical protein
MDVNESDETRAKLESITAHSGLSPALAELIHDLLQRWPALEPARRGELARSVLARADASVHPAHLARLSDDELSRRLRQMLDGDR